MSLGNVGFIQWTMVLCHWSLVDSFFVEIFLFNLKKRHVWSLNFMLVFVDLFNCEMLYLLFTHPTRCVNHTLKLSYS